MGRRVLLVEDELELQVLWAEILEARGYDVQTASTVAASTKLLAAASPPFDLALIDWTLPDGTGAEVIAEVARSKGATSSVITSGLGNRLPPGHGADEVLPKPFRIRELLELLERRCPKEP